MSQQNQPPKKIRVGLVFGGRSGEHEVSLTSAKGIMQAMDPARYEIVPIGITKAGQWLTGENIHQRLLEAHVATQRGGRERALHLGNGGRRGDDAGEEHGHKGQGSTAGHGVDPGAVKQKARGTAVAASGRDLGGASGTRTPDLRIMIPSL